jgi:hypothetical protein
VLAQALEGLDPYVIVIPAGWEPVVGDYTSAEVSYALTHWHAARPNSIIGYHGSPARLVGSSNCDPRTQQHCTPYDPEDLSKGGYESDDPWKGGESIFYKQDGGEYIQIALYQTPHGASLYRACSETQDDCWLNRFDDYVTRIGGGLNGWRVLKLVLYETCAYEFFHRYPDDQGQPVEAAQCRALAQRGQQLAAKRGVAIGFGNGLP